MKLGKLRHRITLQRNYPEKNTIGEPIPNWIDIATVNAEVTPLRGREFYSAQQINHEITTRVRLRFYKGIKPDDRVIFGDEVLTIVFAQNVNHRNQELILLCKHLY